MGSFSAFSNNNIRNTGGIRFAARWDPQNRKAKRAKKMFSELLMAWVWKPNIEDINEGNMKSKIPKIDINDAASK